MIDFPYVIPSTALLVNKQWPFPQSITLFAKYRGELSILVLRNSTTDSWNHEVEDTIAKGTRV